MNKKNSDETPLGRQVDSIVLELLDPLHRLGPEARRRLVDEAVILRLSAGESVSAGRARGLMLYLLSGSLTREAPDCVPEPIGEANASVAEPLIPEWFPDATRLEAVSDTELIAFDRALFEHLLAEVRDSMTGDDSPMEGPERELFEHVMRFFEKGELRVPRVPGTTERLIRGFRDTTRDEPALALLVEADPVIAARVARGAGVNSIPEAVASLGAQAVRRMAISHALEETCNPRSPLVRERMLRVHRHSIAVGAFSRMIATRKPRLNPDKALLCGLLHDIGALAVLDAADPVMDRIGNGAELDALTWRLHSLVGGLILGRWGFDQDVVTAAEESDDWRRDPARKADYTDVVLVAQLHSFIGTTRALWLPQFATVPAFRKIAGSDPGPKVSLWLLRQGKKRLTEMEVLVGGW